MGRIGSVAFAAVVICAGGCTLAPPTVAPPGRPRVEPAAGVRGAPPKARVAIHVPRSADDGQGLELVQTYVLLRRNVAVGGPARPFHYVQKEGPGEALYFDVSATPGARYQYVAWAIAAQEVRLFGVAGALPTASPASAEVVASSPHEPWAAPAPIGAPTDVRVDAPELDSGTSILLKFHPSAEDRAEGPVASYVVMRSDHGGRFRPFVPQPLDRSAAPIEKKIEQIAPSDSVRLEVWAVPVDGEAISAGPSQPVTMHASIIDPARLNVGFVIVLMVSLTFLFMRLATMPGAKMFIRRIPGVDAIEEAVGRATEMGRPILYVPGIDEIQNIQTIASILILGRVAELVARYDSEIKVPCCIPIVAAVGEEVVRQGFYDAGRPDAHRPQNIQWISSEQFAFCAGTNGIMLREKPATNIFLGRFFAESLILAETGYVNRAIQIGGTAEITQLPFFIAACDYTLLGEELFAVSAYMSRDPRLLSTLKAADWIKAVTILVLVAGVAIALAAPDSPAMAVINAMLQTAAGGGD